MLASSSQHCERSAVSCDGFVKHALNRLGGYLVSKLRAWTKPSMSRPLAGVITDLSRSKQALLVEKALLREQLLVLEHQVKRPKLNWWDRALVVVLASQLASWKDALLIVKPDMVQRWHRDLFHWVWQSKSHVKAKPRQPPLASENVALIRRLARENIAWGAERIRGELL